MEVVTQNLVQAIEVYRPDAKGERLVPCAGCSDTPSVDDVRIGDGLFGQVWEEGVPAIAPHEDNHNAATIAIPCVRGDEGRGLVVLRCDAGSELRGAFEVWRRDDRGELGLADGWYANLDRVQQITQYIKFPQRAGLPGRVWEDRFPRVLGGLAESKHFIRVAAARSEKLSAALGVPYMREPPVFDAALLILNAEVSPIAKAMEVWARDLETGQLRIVSADYGPYTELASVSRRLGRRQGEGIVGHVFEKNAPWMTRDLLGVEFPRGEKFVEYGFDVGVGFPVFVGGDLVACVNLYL